MGKIYCLTGKSGTGKDTLYHAIMEDPRVIIKPIIPYTTRPMRNNEQSGVQYHFVSEADFLQLQSLGKIIEKREYDTILGKWYYFTVDHDIVFQNDYLMITTFEALDKLYTWYGQDKIVVIYLEIDDQIRLERAIQRESLQTHPNFAEVCRRYLADEVDFSQENLKTYHTIQRLVTTASIEKCVDEFIGIINHA